MTKRKLEKLAAQALAQPRERCLCGMPGSVLDVSETVRDPWTSRMLGPCTDLAHVAQSIVLGEAAMAGVES